MGNSWFGFERINMKVITEERLNKILNSAMSENFDIEISVIKTLLDTCLEEIDTLTVSKLRPICDAPRDEFISVFISESSIGRESYTKDGITFYIEESEIASDCLDGWIPAIIYKPELTGE